MSNISRKIAKKYRYIFYYTLALSAFSGSIFWLLRKFAMVEGDFGPESHALQYPVLQLHGFAAFMMLMALGAIFTAHIPKTWYKERAKKTGSTLLGFVIFSLLSAYSLYYLVSEDWHVLLGNSHAIIGLCLPVLLIFHIKTARSAGKFQKKPRIKKSRKIATSSSTHHEA
tara:strand:+ start:11334 stop:11843 length:510 start_codon:yes stop_codon:yes gene_type:complete